jgi:LmbE family N-acetylglucosaminyl deacetylase
LKRKIVALGAPIPFQLEPTCFGTLMKLMGGGNEVHLIVAKDGNMLTNNADGSKNMIILESIQRSSKLLGAKLHFLDGFNYSEVSQRNVNILNSVIQSLDPSLVFIPNPRTSNLFYAVLGECAFLACREIKNVLFYEIDINLGFLPNIYSDIGEEGLALKIGSVLESCDDSQLARDTLKLVDTMRKKYAEMANSGNKNLEAFAAHRLQLLSGEDPV